ncbi:ATP-binding protein [Actinomadura luteofluorescens]|uniref:ATP-binding protein n=1 Tax=Actinomadura luteofluorescens TaxID=46163 RepID=UPI00362A514D
MFIGRDRELGHLAGLLVDARAGRSRTVVVQGEAGIGKTALVEQIAAGAGDMRIIRGTGVESETELAFGGLHLMLHPYGDRLDALPGQQAAALRSAFGLGSGPAGDRFLIGAATLTLLSELAADRPLVCLVDDAQWLDTASLDALLFAARRLGADPISMIFTARDGARPFPDRGLEVLRLTGLDRAAAEDLVAARAPGLTVPVRERLLDEAAGNPLALIELGNALRSRPARPAGPLPVGGRVQETFRRRLAELPDATRRLLLVVAADGTADLGIVLRAGDALGLTPADLGPAEEAGLVVLDGEEVRFRHPLIRAVTYQDAAHHRRIDVHGALAGVLRGDEHADRRAWHLAAAATGPDEGVAAELERVAHRAELRGGTAAVATAYERAARLSTEPEGKARRLVHAARASYDATARPGHPPRRGGRAPHRAGRRRRRGHLHPRPGRLRARLARGRRRAGAAGGGAHRRERSRAGGVHADGGRLVRPRRRRPRPGAARRRAARADPAARRFAEGVGDRRADRLRAAGGRRGGGRPPDAGPVRGGAERRRRGDRRTDHRRFHGPARGRRPGRDRAAGGHGSAGQGTGRARLAPLHPGGPRDRAGAARRPARRGRRGVRGHVAGRRHRHGHAGDRAAVHHGAAGVGRRAEPDPGAGRPRTRRPAPDQHRARVVGPRPARPRRGERRAALDRLDAVCSGPARHDVLIRAVPDHAEAAVRAGRPELARTYLPAFETWAAATSSTALVSRCRALLATGDEADEHYRTALGLHGDRAYDAARTRLLYGERLRRGAAAPRPGRS